MANDEVFFAKIRPLQKDRQHVRSYSVFGMKFTEGRWFRLPRNIVAVVQNEKKTIDLMEYMRDAQNEHHVHSERIFDVVNTEEQAQELDDRRREEEEAKSLPVRRAVDMAPGVPGMAPQKRRPGRPRKNPPILGGVDNDEFEPVA